MKKFTVIVPILEVTKDNKQYLERALASLQSNKDYIDVLIVAPPSVPKQKIEGITPQHVVNNGHTDFCSQVNLGIDNVKTEWFSILEMDDEYSPKWFKNVDRYAEVYKDVDAFLPLVADVTTEEKFISFTNESVWAVGFSNIQGFLDNEILLEYENYQITGGVYRTEKIRKLGKLKSNITLTFGYEFLLRLTHNNARVFVIPKIGYKHTNMRENSLFWNYKNKEEVKLTPETTKFWMGIAKKEYFFTEGRLIDVPSAT